MSSALHEPQWYMGLVPRTMILGDSWIVREAKLLNNHLWPHCNPWGTLSQTVINSWPVSDLKFETPRAYDQLGASLLLDCSEAKPCHYYSTTISMKQTVLLIIPVEAYWELIKYHQRQIDDLELAQHSNSSLMKKSPSTSDVCLSTIEPVERGHRLIFSILYFHSVSFPSVCDLMKGAKSKLELEWKKRQLMRDTHKWNNMADFGDGL